MLKLLEAVSISFLVTFLLVPVIIYIFRKKQIFDEPDRRKIHKRVTPSLGGIGIFLGFGVACAFLIPFNLLVNIKFLLGGLTIIFITGVRDDLVPLRPLYKLAGQVIAATMVLFLNKVQLNSFYGLFGLGEMHPAIACVITIFTIIVITNSFNLIDGIDGLAGTIATIALLFFGGWFYLTGDLTYALFSFCLLGGTLAFLTFNWEPSKIFMGDTGSLVLGFALAALSIHFIDSNFMLSETSPYKFNGSIGTAVCVMIIPLFDTLRVFIIRISQGRSPFSPDKLHIHHLLMRLLAIGHAGAACIMALTNLGFIGLALLAKPMKDNLLVPLAVGVALILSLLLDLLINKKFPRKVVTSKLKRQHTP